MTISHTLMPTNISIAIMHILSLTNQTFVCCVKIIHYKLDKLTDPVNQIV